MSIHSILPAIGNEKKSLLCQANSPHSNTGVLTSEINVRPDNLWCVGSRENRPDFEGLTGNGSNLESAKKWKNFSRKLFLLFSASFLGPTITFTSSPEKGKNFYEKGFYIRQAGKELASICYDGKQQNGTFLIILTGEFCSKLTLRQWRLISRLLVRFDMRLTRFDIAVDDYKSEVFDIVQIEKLAKRKNSKWFLPVYRDHGISPKCWKVEGENNSSSVYIGSVASTIQVCVYEKGKQLKNTYFGRQNPEWIRYEVRFKAKGGVLDIAMVLPENWLSAAAGTSVFLNSRMRVIGDKFTMNNKQASEDTLDRAVNTLLTLRKQYGPTIEALVDILGPECLLDAIARSADNAPLAGLSEFDAGEIMSRFDSALLGGLRSSDPGAESLDDIECLF